MDAGLYWVHKEKGVVVLIITDKELSKMRHGIELYHAFVQGWKTAIATNPHLSVLKDWEVLDEEEINQKLSMRLQVHNDLGNCVFSNVNKG